MVTAYSPILKLALPVQGELSGTWGDVVNDNITSMVEQAIAGRAVIDTWTTNSHVLTTANGTTSESRCAMLEFTDTGTALSGAGTVTCPTLSKIYIAKNASGQNVTLKTSGGTGILVPNGRTMFLFCDGTNVVEAVTSTTSLQLGTSTIVTAVLDEDNMASDSATSLATQQSIKAYVDSQVGANNELSEVLANGNTSGANDIIMTSGQKITTNTIDETTAASGVTIDSVLLKDDGVNATNLEITNIKANDGTAAGSIADSTGVVTILSSILTTADINGGTADGVIIGGTTPAAATVTNLIANTDLIIAGTTTITAVLDEDNMASDSATALATQQSIKAYVDSQVGTVDTLAEILAIGNTTGGTDIVASTTDKVQFRDAAIYINSSVDGQLDIVADTEIQIAATTVDVNGALDVSGTALVTGVLTTTAATVSNGGGQFNGAINVGVDDTGYDVKFFGATAGAYMLWDESADDLILGGAAGLSVNSTALVTGVLTTTAATVFNGGFAAGGVGTFADGSNSAPSLTNTGDLNTGLYFPAADEVGLTVGGTQRLNVSATGISVTGTVVADGLSAAGLISTTASQSTDGQIRIRNSTTRASGNKYGIRFADSSFETNASIYAEQLSSGANGADLIFGTNNNTGGIGLTSATERMRISSSGGLITNPAAGGHAVFNEGGVDADFRVESDGNANMLFVDGGANKVGMGVIPETVLSVKGGGSNGFTSGTVPPGITLFGQDTDGYGTALTFKPNEGGQGIAAIGSFRSSTYHTDLRFYTNNVASGNAFSEKMSLSGSGALVTKPLAGGHAVFNESGADVDFRVESDTDANALFVEGSSGNVGIGTSSPSRQLTVSNSGAVLFSLVSTGDDNCQVLFGDSASDTVGKVLYNHSSNAMSFETNGSEAMRINSSGGLITNPSAGGHAVFNEDGIDADFRVESDGNANMLFVDGGANTVSIGANSASNISPLNIQADEAGARAIRIVGRTDDYSELDFYENDNSTILARLQAHSSVLNIRSYGPPMVFQQTNADCFRITTTEAVFNESGADRDFRVESDTNANMLTVDAGNNTLGIGKFGDGGGATSKGAYFNDSAGNFFHQVNTHTSTTSTHCLLYLNRQSSDGDLVEFRQADSAEGTISVSGSTVSYNGFSGRHESSGIPANTPVGTVVSTINELDVYPDNTTNIEGNIVPHKKAGQTRADHAKVEVSTSAGDPCVYGVVSEFNGDGKLIVTSVGVGSIRVTGACSKGDLLESNGDGTAKVQSDDIIRSKTIGKVTIGNSDTGVKLVACVMYCG
jgi:hypothetical protein